MLPVHLPPKSTTEVIAVYHTVTVIFVVEVVSQIIDSVGSNALRNIITFVVTK